MSAVLEERALDADGARSTDEALTPARALQAQACAAYIAALHEGRVMSVRELGTKFGKGPSWGRARVRDARANAEVDALARSIEGRARAIDATARTAELAPVRALPERAPLPEPAPAERAPEPPERAPATSARPPERAVSDGVMRTTRAAAIVVGLVSAVGCYEHLHHLAREAGLSPLLALIYPFLVEGLMVVATLAAVVLRTKLAWFSLAAGLGASLTGNALAVAPELVEPIQIKIGIGVSFPLALFLTAKLLVQLHEAHEAAGR